jgi:hypothetical protein
VEHHLDGGGMTTYPLPIDPVSALSRADGRTTAHSADHGRLIDGYENVKAYGAVADGVTDDSAAFQAAVDAAEANGHAVFIPGYGSYYFADGAGVTVPANVQIVGQDPYWVHISVKDAYAFTSDGNIALNVANVRVIQRSGTTTGGGFKGISSGRHRIINCQVDGVATCTEPAIYLYGCINASVEKCVVVSGGDGILLGTGASFANRNTVDQCVVRTLSTTNYGIHLQGSNNIVRDCNIEANQGTAVYDNGGNWNSIQSCWFESNAGPQCVLAEDSIGLLLTHNKFNGGAGPSITCYVEFTETDANSYGGNIVAFNTFQDPYAPNVIIGANVGGTVLFGNRKLDRTTVSDSGIQTVYLANTYAGAEPNNVYGKFRQMWLQTAAAGAASGGSPFGTNSVFSASDDDATNYFMVGTRGIPIFRTGDTTVITGSDELQTNSFAFYWDDVNNRLMARSRGGAGYLTHAVGYPVASAYTQTYSTADKTHANPTASTLTVSDGAGTNDNTIGAITADASVIAAVQELADEINKLVADVADTKQLCNSIIDDLQAAGIVG